MTLDNAHKLTVMHSGLATIYKAFTWLMAFREVLREQEQTSVNVLNKEYDFERQWENKPGAVYGSALA